MFDKNLILEKLKYQIKNGNIVMKIIILNVALYLLGNILNIIGLIFTSKDVLDTYAKFWLYIPSQIMDFIYIPYTLISYQFLHAGFIHILSNMAIIYYFGSTFITLTSKKKFLPLYILGGIFSGIFYLLIFNTIPILKNESIYLVGASGSAMAILAAVSTLIPEREILLFRSFRVKYKWIALFFLVINLMSVLSIFNINGNEFVVTGIGGNLAHIGGLIFGYLFVVLNKKGFNMAKPVNKIINYISSLFANRKKPRVSYVSEKFKTKKQFDPYKIDKETEQKINAILDKIKESGYDNLTKAEKDFLFNNSNK